MRRDSLADRLLRRTLVACFLLIAAAVLSLIFKGLDQPVGSAAPAILAHDCQVHDSRVRAGNQGGPLCGS